MFNAVDPIEARVKSRLAEDTSDVDGQYAALQKKDARHDRHKIKMSSSSEETDEKPSQKPTIKSSTILTGKKKLNLKNCIIAESEPESSDLEIEDSEDFSDDENSLEPPSRMKIEGLCDCSY